MKSARKLKTTLLVWDTLIVILTMIFTLLLKTGFEVSAIGLAGLAEAGIFLVFWISISIVAGKLRIGELTSMRKIVYRILKCNFLIMGAVAIVLILLRLEGISRFLLFGSFAAITLMELITGLVLYEVQHSLFLQEWIGPERFSGIRTNGLIKPGGNGNGNGNGHAGSDLPILNKEMQEAIVEFSGKAASDWLHRHARLTDPGTLLLDTSTRFNVLNLSTGQYTSVVNIHRINDIRRINKFFEAVNEKLPLNGYLIGCGETYTLRKNRILRKYPPVINYLVYTIDFIYRRVFPKLKLTNKLYFLLSGGKNRVISRTEILGRLYSCGFEVEEASPVGDLLYFKARKTGLPCYDHDPTYGILIRLRRIGKGGREFNVFKLRTMHAYAEYVQGYAFEQNQLGLGGKISDDFRVSTLGRLLRKFWIDELPMLYNVLRGDLKFFGVRPLSKHYFGLYTPELQQERIKCKPGLIPPYYAAFPTPQTLEEIQANEWEYLTKYSRHPLWTDVVYFHRAMVNIVFRRARSK